MNWTFEIIRDWNVIWSDEHRKRWLQHMDAADNAHVFFHPALAKAWVETYLPLRSLAPLFVWARQGEIQVMLPLVLWKKNWKGAFMRSVIPFGYSDFDYHDPIVIGVVTWEVMVGFWDALKEEVAKLVSFDSMEIDGVHQAFAPSWLLPDTKEACPYIDLTSFRTIEDYQETLSSKLRGDLRRVMRRLKEQGKVTIDTFHWKDIEKALSDLPLLLELHSQRWPQAYKAPYFHENLIKRSLEAGVMHFTRVSVNNTPISWIIAFVYKGRYAFWMPTMNPEFARFSPGKINLQFCIQYALENGLHTYDHLRGDELYKSKLTPNCDFVYSAVCCRTSVGAQMKRRLLNLKKRLRT